MKRSRKISWIGRFGTIFFGLIAMYSAYTGYDGVTLMSGSICVLLLVVSLLADEISKRF